MAGSLQRPGQRYSVAADLAVPTSLWDGTPPYLRFPALLRGERFSGPLDRRATQHWPVWRPLLGVVFLTLMIRWTDLDPAISALFFDSQMGDWSWGPSWPVQSLYLLGPVPAFLLAGGGALAWLMGWKLQGTAAPPNSAKFLVVLFLIGPGLVVNVAFKQTWGRPRPSQVRQFGGDREFVPVGTPGAGQHRNSSFPSGHAATAFYLMAPAFVVRSRRPRLAAGVAVAGGLFGLLMGLTRIAQGGHWASDILWSAVIVYLTAVILARWLLVPIRRPTPAPASR